MNCGRHKYQFALYILLLCRSGNLYKLSNRRSNQFIMSKSIRNFFASSAATTTDEGPNKKAKIMKEDIAPIIESSTNLEKEPVCPDASSITLESESTESKDETSVGWEPFDTMEPGWKTSLAPEFKKPYFQRLLTFLTSEIKSQTVFPPAKDIFTAFNLCPLDNVKVLLQYLLLPLTY